MNGRSRAVCLAVCVSSGALSSLTAGCGAAEKAAAKDPMRCERDPSCGKGRDVYADCTKQCADDPECTDRCRGMQPDRMGHP